MDNSIYVVFLRLTPAFADNLARAGVMEAVKDAALEHRAPAAEVLASLGVPADFATLFIKRLAYLLALKQAGVLMSAGPFADLVEGLYICSVGGEEEARQVLLDDPLYQAGWIEKDFTVRRWLAAI